MMIGFDGKKYKVINDREVGTYKDIQEAVWGQIEMIRDHIEKEYTNENFDEESTGWLVNDAIATLSIIETHIKRAYEQIKTYGEETHE